MLRVPAENGQLIDRTEVLLDETTIQAARAGLQNYFRIIDAANALVAKGKNPADHYPQTNYKHVGDLEDENSVEVWDLCMNEDFWYNREEILLERIFVNVIR